MPSVKITHIYYAMVHRRRESINVHPSWGRIDIAETNRSYSQLNLEELKSGIVII